MYYPSLALSWQVLGRHRWGLMLAVAIVAGICALPRAFPESRLLADAGDTGVPWMLMVLMPLGYVFIYFAYAFSHAELGSRVRSSGFPVWMFTLPVRTPWLVVWPMLYGAVTVTLTWLAVGWFALNKMGLEVPLYWPALGLACTLAWIQAVDWSPLGSIGKAVAAGAVLAGLWTGLLRDDAHDATAAALPAILVLAYVGAVVGVSRARRGGRTEGAAWRPAVTRAVSWRPGHRRPFDSPHQAQVWLEWRRNGNLLPLFAAIWVAFGTVLVYLTDGHATVELWTASFYLFLVFTPLFGLILGKPDVWSRQLRLPTFAAARPLSCGDVVVAKFRMAARSLLTAWLVLVGGGLLWLTWIWNTGPMENFWERHLPLDSWGPRVYLHVACIVGGAYGFMLLHIVGNFVVSMTGRLWVVMAVLFFYLAGIPNLLALSPWSQNERLGRFLADAWDWLLPAAVVVKLSLAGWAFHRGYQRRMLTVPAIAGMVAVWLATVLSIFGIFALEYSRSPRAAEMAGRNTALCIIMVCPLFRIALAPLALAWNRHR